MTLNREDIEAIAAQVVELMREVGTPEKEPVGELIDAAAVARRLGISRATVYAKANQLGAIRLGTGKRARLRFDPANLPTRALENGRGKASRRRAGRAPSHQGNVELLPIRGVSGAPRPIGPKA